MNDFAENTTNCNHYGLRHCSEIDKFFKIFPLLVGPIILLSNTLIMIVIATTKTLRDNSCYYVFSLASADFLVGLFSSIQSHYTIGNTWPSRLESVLIGSAVTTCASLSITTLAVMSVDRYMALKLALNYEQIWTFKRCLLSIATLWIVNISVEAIGCTVLGKVSYSEKAYANFIDTQQSRWFLLFYTFVIYIPAVCIILASYLKIFSITRRHLRDMASNDLTMPATNGQTSTTDHIKHLRRLIKAARTIFIAVCFFLACWSPYFSLQMVAVVSGHEVYTNQTIGYMLPWLAVCNSFMNPFIYTISNRTYREAFISFIDRFVGGKLTKMMRSKSNKIRVKPAPS